MAASLTSQLLRDDDGGGSWQHQQPIPDDLTLRYEGCPAALALAGEIYGVWSLWYFFEQVGVWQRIVQAIRQLQAQGISRRFLLIYFLAGCASLIAAAAGARIYSVDSAKIVLNWGKANAAASGCQTRRFVGCTLIAAILSLWAEKRFYL